MLRQILPETNQYNGQPQCIGQQRPDADKLGEDAGEPGEEGEANDAHADEQANGAGGEPGRNKFWSNGDGQRVDGGKAEADEAEADGGDGAERDKPDEQQANAESCYAGVHQNFCADAESFGQRLQGETPQREAEPETADDPARRHRSLLTRLQ